MWSTRVCLAAGLTAMRALSFSSAVSRISDVAAIARERVVDVWKVPTIGPTALQHAISDRLGVAGSWTCSTSNSPSRSQRRTRRRRHRSRRSAARPSRCTGTGTARPAGTTYGGSASSSSAGAMTDTSWPSPISVSARSRTCAWTPPGKSHEYGQTMPTLMRRRAASSAASSARAGRGRRATAAGACASPRGARRCPVSNEVATRCVVSATRALRSADGGQLERRVDLHVRAAVGVVPEVDGDQRRAGEVGEHRRAGGHPRGRAEELDRDAAAGQVAVGRAGTTSPPARSRPSSVPTTLSPPVERQHLHAERLAVGDEPVVQRLRLEPLGDRRERRAASSRPEPRPRRRRGPSWPCAAARGRRRARSSSVGAAAPRCRACARGRGSSPRDQVGSRNTSHQ